MKKLIALSAAGLIGLATLHPRAQRWLETRTSTTATGTPDSSAAVPAHVPIPVPLQK